MPVYDIFDRLYKKRKLPQVFVCANDTMALAIYQKAQEYALKIPDDIAVVGFDGLPYSPYMSPTLATCGQNDEGLISIINSIIEGICDHSLEPGCFFNSYKAAAGGSCGCKAEYAPLSNNVIIDTFRGLERSSFHEDCTFNVIERAIDFDCQSNIYEILLECSIPYSSVCIKGDYSSTMNNLEDSEKGFSDKFYVLTSQNSINETSPTLRVFSFDEMVPYLSIPFPDISLTAPTGKR